MGLLGQLVKVSLPDVEKEDFLFKIVLQPKFPIELAPNESYGLAVRFINTVPDKGENFVIFMQRVE